MPRVVTFPAGSTNFHFLVSEANGYLSREEGTVAAASGVIPGGTIMTRLPAGTFRPWAPGDTNASILGEDTDATTAAIKRTLFVRLMEVQRADLFFVGTPTDAEKLTAYNQLAAAHITLR